MGLLNTGAEIVTWPASANPGSLAAMGPNRRAQEREQATAERKAAADAREIVAKAERSASRRARRRRALIRDVVIASAIAFIIFGAWKVIALLARVVAVP